MKAFTLIEVVISVVILSLVGAALLKNAGMNMAFFSKLQKKNGAIDAMSIVAHHPNLDFNHLQKPLYAFIESDYHIDDDELKSLLKKEQFSYQERILKVVMPKLEGFDKEGKNQENENLIDLDLIKISIHNQELGDSIYIAKIKK